MIDENLTSVLNFESEIGIDGTIKLPKEKLIEIRSKGFKKVNVVLFGSSKTAVAEKGIDQNLFDNIERANV